jgi:hypothetical protein
MTSQYIETPFNLAVPKRAASFFDVGALRGMGVAILGQFCYTEI